MFLIKSIRVTEYCTKSLCYVYMITTTIFVFLFKIFLEIFKNMKNANVSLFFEWMKEKRKEKYITSMKESILLSLNKTKHY